MDARRFLLTVAFAAAFACSSRGTAAAAPPPSLKQGAQGPAVLALQQALADRGYFSGKADGLFGPCTRAAVMAFQRDNHLTADGVAGEHTLAALREPVKSSRGLAPGTVANILQTARRFLGTKYVWGGTTPRGFDCSGFVYHVLNACGIKIPRGLDAQFAGGAPVSRKDLKAGDLVFFTTYKPGPSHVGIYLGDGAFIHASSARRSVTVTSIDKPYYVKNWVGARRLTAGQ